MDAFGTLYPGDLRITGRSSNILVLVRVGGALRGDPRVPVYIECACRCSTPRGTPAYGKSRLAGNDFSPISGSIIFPVISRAVRDSSAMEIRSADRERSD